MLTPAAGCMAVTATRQIPSRTKNHSPDCHIWAAKVEVNKFGKSEVHIISLFSFNDLDAHGSMRKYYSYYAMR